MKNLSKFFGITAAVTILSLAGCSTFVPIKSVKMPAINGMDTIKNLGIRDFENRSGVRGALGTQLTQYLTDKAKSMIPAAGKFNMVAPADPNADGIFFGELRSVESEESQSQSERKDKNGNTVTTITYTRNVSVTFVYGVRSSRTGMELGTVTKEGSTSTSAESRADLIDTLALAKSIVDSQMRSLEQDIIPTVVSTNRQLMNETSKDKNVKRMMKTALAVVKNGNYIEAIRQYDEIADRYGSAAAAANADILRMSLESDAAANARIAQIESERSGWTDRAVNNVIDTLNSKLPSGTIIMLMKSNSTEFNMLSDVVDRITTTVVQEGRLKLVDRSNQTLINTEQQFQLSGNVDDNTAVSIGRQLGARYAVFCWISGTASSRKFNLRLLDIETSQITDQTSFDI